VSTTFEITVAENPPDEARAAIAAELTRHTAEFLPDAGERVHFAVLVNNGETGAVLGGIWARAWRNMLSIELVALPPELRGAGLGSRLLRMAEEEGRRRDCVNVWLQTADWQARGFYEKHGYRVFGELDDWPIGHKRFFMTKRLAA
jgi:GNAT superfamily N-acetyltransferase